MNKIRIFLVNTIHEDRRWAQSSYTYRDEDDGLITIDTGDGKMFIDEHILSEVSLDEHPQLNAVVTDEINWDDQFSIFDMPQKEVCRYGVESGDEKIDRVPVVVRINDDGTQYVLGRGSSGWSGNFMNVQPFMKFNHRLMRRESAAYPDEQLALELVENYLREEGLHDGRHFVPDYVRL